MLASRNPETCLFRDRSPLLILVLAALFVGGLAIRLTDLTDLPLDFNPTRQPDTRAFFDSHFTLVERGEGYLLYDLTRPKSTAP